MEVADVLDWRGVTTPLRRPVMVLALAGYFDYTKAASAALHHLLRSVPGELVARIDADPFFDFTQERPVTRFTDDDERFIKWPSNEFVALRFPGAARDIVVLNGIEPHLRWETFVHCITAVYARLDCEAIVTLGASPDRVPHTRTPPVVGSSADEKLARTLGLTRPSYQGLTGVIGVLQTACDREQWPAVSLRVGVPDYLKSAQHPQASAALLRHLEHVLGVPTAHDSLNDRVTKYRSVHDELVADDPETKALVTILERLFDAAAEKSITSGDDLAEQFQRYLDEQP